MAAATLLADPNEPFLGEVCGIRAPELELGRQTFVRLWNEYNFVVKTFQESVIASYQYPELRAETVSRGPPQYSILSSPVDKYRQYDAWRVSSAIRGRTQKLLTHPTTTSASSDRPKTRDTAH